ncbi:MAG: hypothetical protein U5M23_09210 [Marinagarivorans sp.]|nr:hypothetical protein [Marinagarivorans sp.]
MFLPLNEDWADFKVDITEIVGGGGVVIMFGRYSGTSRKTGKPLDVQAAHMVDRRRQGGALPADGRHGQAARDDERLNGHVALRARRCVA